MSLSFVAFASPAGLPAGEGVGAPGCFSGIYFGDTLGIYMAIIGLGARQGGGAGPSWLICTSTYWS